MKRLLTIATAVLVPVMAWAGVEGDYRTEKNDNGDTAVVRIAPCGDALCGTIVSTTSDNKKAVGMKIVWDMKASGENSWKGGKIKDPTDDSVYASKMSLSGDNLKVSGCVAGGLICKSQTWVRVN